jgi:hypothetical protein
VHEPGREPRDVLRPCASGEDEPLGLDDAAFCTDAHAVPRLGPLEDALARPQGRPPGQSSLDVRDDAALRDDEAAVRLVGDLHLRG